MTNPQLIADIVSEIEKKITEIPPLIDKEKLLKHLAAASIHITFFMNDLYEDIEGYEPFAIDKELEKIFIEECGCNLNKKGKA